MATSKTSMQDFDSRPLRSNSTPGKTPTRNSLCKTSAQHCASFSAQGQAELTFSKGYSNWISDHSRLFGFRITSRSVCPPGFVHLNCLLLISAAGASSDRMHFWCCRDRLRLQSLGILIYPNLRNTSILEKAWMSEDKQKLWSMNAFLSELGEILHYLLSIEIDCY